MLSQRELNRALLSRQLLLDRVDLPEEAGRRRADRHRRPGQQRAQVRREAERMLAFCAPGATHDLRFAPIA